MKIQRVIMFNSQFAHAVESGQKVQTIRSPFRRPIEVGDLLSLRTWTGKAYRSKQRILISDAVCVDVAVVSITPEALIYKGHILSWQTRFAEKFAQHDGFLDGTGALRNYLEDTYGLPFAGVCIKWKGRNQ